MAVRPLPALAAVAALLLAGCAHAPAKTPDANGLGASAGPADAPLGLPLPTWSVGDAWTYDLNGTATTYVVTSEAGSDWIVDTDSDERAFGNARDDVSRLGPQRKSDLAGSQGEERVEFFHWPLRENLTWTARWDHLDMTMRVVSVQGTVARLEAANAGKTIYRYTYDAKVGWFRELHHFRPDGGELIGFTLNEAVHGWKGTVVRYDVKSLYSKQGENGGADAKNLQPDATATDLWVSYHLVCTNGGFSLTLLPADPANAANTPNVGHVASGPCTKVDIEKAAPGPMTVQWAFGYSWGSAPPMTYTVDVLQRTRTTLPVGA